MGLLLNTEPIMRGQVTEEFKVVEIRTELASAPALARVIGARELLTWGIKVSGTFIDENWIIR